MKILHLPSSVGGNSYGLSTAEKEIGLDSSTLYLSDNWLHYKGDKILSPVDFAPLNLLCGALEAFKIKNSYDVLHFNYGASLIDWQRFGINHWDLPLYKKSKFFVTYNGCDARLKHERVKQAEICACKYDDCYGGICKGLKTDEIKKKRIEQFEKFGAHFFSLNPDLMNFLPKGTVFLPYTIANWHEIEPIPQRKFTFPINIVHAPSNRVAKGSDAVISIIKELNSAYPGKINFTLVENISHEQALDIYKKADLVIDQLRIGWYGAFAVEVMKMGKPVIAYINEDDLHFLPNDMAEDCLNAIINANEYNLYHIIEQIILNPKILEEKRKKAIEYVLRYHEPVKVAQITKDAYYNI